MEKETVIKALEQEIHLAEYVDSSYCDRVAIDLMKDALALIKELTEKVEAYRQELGKVRVALNNANVDNKRLTEENERLKKDNEYILMQHAFQRRPSGDCWNDVIEKAKADTVREFAERLKAICRREMIFPSTIDRLAEEILNKTEE